MKTCSRCGELKPLVDFRDYYNRKGKYKFCKDCERIETKRKYLAKLGDAATPAQRSELSAILLLYDKRYEAGLDVPGRPRAPKQSDVSSLVDRQLAKFNEEEIT